MKTTKKIIKMSGSFYVGIPIIWAQFNKLKPGDKLDISVTDDKLIITNQEGGLA